MKRYGVPDVELKDTQRNNVQFLCSTLQVARLNHYHRHEGCGVNFADNQVIDPRIATCCRSTQRLPKNFIARFAHKWAVTTATATH